MKITLQETEFNILTDIANTNDGAAVFEAGEEYNGLFITDAEFKRALAYLEQRGLVTVERSQHEVFVTVDEEQCWKVDWRGWYDTDGQLVERS